MDKSETMETMTSLKYNTTNYEQWPVVHKKSFIIHTLCLIIKYDEEISKLSLIVLIGKKNILE